MNIQKHDHVRLRKLIDNREAVDNIIHVYGLLKGKENLDKRLFLKTLVWASIEASKRIDYYAWSPPQVFFLPNEGHVKFSLEKLEKFYRQKRTTWYGYKMDKIFGNLL